MSTTRSVLVEARRLDGWLRRFAERNGGHTVDEVEDSEGQATDLAGTTDVSSPLHALRGPVHTPGAPSGAVRILAANGCSAQLTPPLTAAHGRESDPPDPDQQGGDDTSRLTARLLAFVDPAVTVGLVLIRRGGYSVGVSRAGELLASKTGTRYVQGRTAAGGWSQQRFARRRANQADALVEEAAERAATIFTEHPPSCLQLGGDRTLAEGTIGEKALMRFAVLPRTPFLTVPDPRLAVLKEAARSALSIRITVTDAPPT